MGGVGSPVLFSVSDITVRAVTFLILPLRQSGESPLTIGADGTETNHVGRVWTLM